MDEETKKLIESLRSAVEESTKATQAAQTDAAEARKEAKAARVMAQIEQKLTESKLPEETVARLRAHFEGIDTLEGVDDTIKAEGEYIAKLHARFEAAGKGKGGAPTQRRTNIVVGLGHTGKSEAVAQTENDDEDRPEVTKESFAEAFGEFMPGGKAGAAQFYEAMS